MRFLVLALAIGLLASCNGTTDTIGPSPYMNLNGAWEAAHTVTGGTLFPNGTQFGNSLVLVQAVGGAVTGSFSIQGGASGSITGTIVEHAVVLTATQDPPCAGTFAFVGTVSASYAVLSGTYNGSDCHGTLESQFTAVKQ